MEKTDTWAAFGNEYIKAIEVASADDEYAIVGVESRNENGKDTLHLKLQRGEIEKLFGCNATNTQAIQVECPLNPKQSIGRIITFNKVQVTNPSTKQIVDGLRIQFKPKDEPNNVDTEEAGIQEDGSM
jgi:hypothetical protein